MLIATVIVTPLGGWQVAGGVQPPGRAAGGRRRRHLLVGDPVRDRPAGDGAPGRGTYALMVSLLPATATVVGLVVLAQTPSVRDLAGIALVIVGVAIHRDPVIA